MGFLVLLGRLVDLQIIRGKYFRVLAEENRIRRVPILAPRGKVFARGGEALVDNTLTKKQVVFNPESGYEKHDIEEAAVGEDVFTEYQRWYPFGSRAAHLTGYLGEVTEEEVGKTLPECFEKGPKRLGSFIGRTGLEAQYECLLMGIDGEELVEVDSFGNRIRTLGRKEPIAGMDVRTYIDLGLQQKVSDLMADKKGAVVVTDGRGEVLALYSSPSFDPNVFVNEKHKDQVSKILEDKELPLFNRAIGGKYHPGSVYKPVVAIAALEEGVIDKDFSYQDTGVLTLNTEYGNFSYANWYYTQYGGTEGEIGLTRAIARSTDTFFYKVGELLGVEKLIEWSERFGLDKTSGIDLPGEVMSLVPSPSWKIRTKGERWFLGNTYHMSIGQGDLSLSVVSLHKAILAIANGGNLCSPHLVSEPVCQKIISLDPEFIAQVKEGMKGACTAGGTGFTFFDFSLPVACKTGTAETEEEDKTHAWFTVFSPIENPEIVATVLIEEGGEGSKAAGPIAREIFDYWYVGRNR